MRRVIVFCMLFAICAASTSLAGSPKPSEKVNHPITAELSATTTCPTRDVTFVRYPDAAPDERSRPGPLWTDGDILIAGHEDYDAGPSMASDSDGVLYCTFEIQRATGTDIEIRRSFNGGQTWQTWASVTGAPDFTQPTIAVGEGNGEDRLIQVYVTDWTSLDMVVWDLNSPTWWNVTLEYNASGICNPQIVTDAVEYSTWYPYVVYNSRAVDSWILRFSRSTDYGVTWAAPATLHSYRGTPNTYSGYDAHPDVEFGSGYLYVGYDDYPGVNTVRDVYVLRSTDFGTTWSAPMTVAASATYDQFAPRIGAVKNYGTGSNTVVAYSKYFGGFDWDIWYAYTMDGGDVWTIDRAIASAYDRLEIYCDIAASYDDRGRIHVAFYDHGTIRYVYTYFDDMTSWTPLVDVSDTEVADLTRPRPAVAAIAGSERDSEVGIAWTDARTVDRQVYYDGPGTPPAGVEDDNPSSREPVAVRCYPNPFTSTTLISFTQAQHAPARVGIYDVSGRLVRLLLDEASGEPGERRLTWDGRESSGDPVGPGIYLVRASAGPRSMTRKLVLLK